MLGGLEMSNRKFEQQINGKNKKTLSMLNQHFIGGQQIYLCVVNKRSLQEYFFFILDKNFLSFRVYALFIFCVGLCGKSFVVDSEI